MKSARLFRKTLSLLAIVVFTTLPFLQLSLAQTNGDETLANAEFDIEAEAGEEIVLTDDTGAIAEIKVTFLEATSCSLTLEYEKFKPTDLPQIPESVNDYLYINLITDCQQDSFESAVLRVRVPKGWLLENDTSANKVSLYHYQTDQWQRLLTQYDSGDTNYAYFTSLVENFSYFAIAATTDNPNVSGEPTPATTGGVAPTTTVTVGDTGASGDATLSYSLIIGGGVAVVIAFGLVGYLAVQLFKD